MPNQASRKHLVQSVYLFSPNQISLTFSPANCLTIIIFVFVAGDGSPYMIFEYMEHGDLTEVLRRNDPCLGSEYHIKLRQVCVRWPGSQCYVYFRIYL